MPSLAGRRRVAVTGLGVVSALGPDRPTFWRRLVAGESGIRPLTRYADAGLSIRVAAEVEGLDPELAFETGQRKQLDRFAQLLLVAAREAVAHARLELAPDERGRAAVVSGATTGGALTEDAAYADLYRRNRPHLHPLTIPRIMPNAGASQVAMEMGITGPTFTFSTACSSSNHALGHAFWMVRSGIVDVALAGGSDSQLNFGNLKAWEAMRLAAPDTCRPFSLDRKGMVLGEGGGILVLEEMERARRRGAAVLAEIVGFGMSSDASHLTRPAVEGEVAAIRAALADAGMAAEEVGYVNAHGTGTAANDATESAALRAVFGNHADGGLAVSSTKSMHGHTLAAAGALEAVATVLALAEGVLPPTANFTAPDPECDLDVVANTSRRSQVNAALSNSFAFGGLNAVLAFRRV
jgi:nodulation protein E